MWLQQNFVTNYYTYLKEMLMIHVFVVEFHTMYIIINDLMNIIQVFNLKSSSVIIFLKCSCKIIEYLVYINICILLIYTHLEIIKNWYTITLQMIDRENKLVTYYHQRFIEKLSKLTKVKPKYLIAIQSHKCIIIRRTASDILWM